MKTSLSHFPRARQETIITIVQMIRKAVNPDKIILFSNPTEPCNELLVITRPEERHYDYEIQDVLTNRCRQYGACTFIIHDLPYVNKCLSEGHPFFYKAITGGALLYDVGRYPLAEPVLPDHTRLAKTARQGFQYHIGQARAFLKCAHFNQDLKEYSITMFLLHQATENAYRAILTVHEGYNPKTHNLDKLRRLTNRFSADLANLFPCSTAEECRLFKTLLNAYVDARYKDGYSISEEQLRLLQERVGQLYAIAERACREHLNSLEESVGAQDYSIKSKN